MREQKASTRARQGEAAATRASHAQAAAADEIARIRADHQRALDQLTTAATTTRITPDAFQAGQCAFDSRRPLS